MHWNDVIAFSCHFSLCPLFLTSCITYEACTSVHGKSNCWLGAKTQRAMEDLCIGELQIPRVFCDQMVVLLPGHLQKHRARFHGHLHVFEIGRLPIATRIFPWSTFLLSKHNVPCLKYRFQDSGYEQLMVSSGACGRLGGRLGSLSSRVQHSTLLPG